MGKSSWLVNLTSTIYQPPNYGIMVSMEEKKLTQADFEKLEKEFLTNLQKIFSDITASIRILRKRNKAFVKSELCLAFTAADTFSRFYKIFQGSSEEELDKWSEDRFKAWMQDFVFNNANEVYKVHKEDIACDTGLAWKLRCSLLHFYGLPSPKSTGGRVGFMGGNPEEVMKMREEFSKRGKHIQLVHPYWLVEAILSGLLVQLQSMVKMIRENPNAYIKGVRLAHKIIMSEGAIFVDIEKMMRQTGIRKWKSKVQTLLGYLRKRIS